MCVEGGQARPPGVVQRGGGRRTSPPPALPVARPAQELPYMPAAWRLFDGGLRSARRRDARCRPDGARGRMPAPMGLQGPEPRRRRPPISPRGVPCIDHSSTVVQPPLFLGGAWRQGHGKPAETQVGGCHFSSSAGWCWGTRSLYRAAPRSGAMSGHRAARLCARTGALRPQLRAATREACHARRTNRRLAAQGHAGGAIRGYEGGCRGAPTGSWQAGYDRGVPREVPREGPAAGGLQEGAHPTPPRDGCRRGARRTASFQGGPA